MVRGPAGVIFCRVARGDRQLVKTPLKALGSLKSLTPVDVPVVPRNREHDIASSLSGEWFGGHPWQRDTRGLLEGWKAKQEPFEALPAH